MSLQTYREMLMGQGFTFVSRNLKPDNEDIFCEVMIDNAWSRISLWYDETGTKYPEEVWALAYEQFPSADWKSIRMVKLIDNKKIVLKIEVKGERNNV